MGNWKSDENIEQFINNSYEPLAKDFLDKGYGFHIDGYSPLPSFRAYYSIKDGQNHSYYDLCLHSQTMGFENYSELIDGERFPDMMDSEEWEKYKKEKNIKIKVVNE